MTIKTKCFNLATIADQLRIFPRAVMATMVYCFVETLFWYFGLQNPTSDQTMALGTITAGLFGLFNSYAKSGVRWSPRAGVGEEENG